MVIRDCIINAIEMLRASGVDNPTLDARVLLCHILGKDNVYLALNPDVEVSSVAIAASAAVRWAVCATSWWAWSASDRSKSWQSKATLPTWT